MSSNERLIDNIFCDVDYTIYNTAEKEYILSTIEALNLAHLKGKKVIVVSSKCKPTLDEIHLFNVLPNLDGYVCTKTGFGNVEEKNYSEPINKKKLLSIYQETGKTYAHELNEIARKSGALFQFIVKDKNEKNSKNAIVKTSFSYNSEDAKFAKEVAERYEKEWNDRIGDSINKYGCQDFDAEVIEKFLEDKRFEVYAIMIFGRPKVIEQVNEMMKGLDLVIEPFDQSRIVNITEVTTNKKRWVSRIIKDNNYEPEHCLAIGDSFDDFEMKDATNDNFIAVEGNESNEAANMVREQKEKLSNGCLEVAVLSEEQLTKENNKTIYDIFKELQLIDPEPFGGFLYKDLSDDFTKKLGIIKCGVFGDKKVDSWCQEDNVYFLGINGYSKVSGDKNDERSNFVKLKKQLTKTDSNQIIKIFLMDPTSDQFIKHISYIQDHDTLESYREAYRRWFELADLSPEHLKLKFYKGVLPCFIKAVENHDISISNFSEDPSSVGSFSKREPTLVISHGSAYEEDGVTKNRENSFFTNLINFFNTKFDLPENMEYNSKKKKRLLYSLDKKINKREKQLRSILFCYSSLDDEDKIFKLKEKVKTWDCSPITWKEYSYSDEWKTFMDITMPTVSCVVFFINDDIFRENNNVYIELEKFYDIRKDIKNKFSFRIQREQKYLLISSGSNTDLIKMFEDEKNKEESVGHSKRLDVINFYLGEMKKNGKVFLHLNDSFISDFKNFLDDKKNGVKPSKDFKLPQKKYQEQEKQSNHKEVSLKNQSAFLANLLRLGIRRCSKDKCDPFKVLESDFNMSNSLKISGITEFSLSLEGKQHAQFVELLDTRLSKSESGKRGKIKVLLIDPKSEAFKEIIQQNIGNNRNIINSHREALKQWVDLANKNKYKEILEIRCFRDGKPLFKMYNAEKTSMLIQPYDNSSKGQQAALSDFPWLCIEHGKPKNSLFAIFDKLFDDMYKTADPISLYSEKDIDDIIDEYVTKQTMKKIEIKQYISEKIKTEKPILAIKTNCILAVPFSGDVYTTFSNGKVESVFHRPKNSSENFFAATKLNKNNEIVVDSLGKKNQWIIGESELNKKYSLVKGTENLYKPKEIIINRFIQVNEDVSYKLGNLYMNLFSGGYINIDSLYCIQKKDFDDTYVIIDK